MLADIVLLKSDINYTHVFFSNGKQMTVAITLKKMESKFEKLGFFRTHKSFIVNPKHIVSYIDVESEIYLSSNLKALVSRRKKVAFEKLIG